MDYSWCCSETQIWEIPKIYQENARAGINALFCKNKPVHFKSQPVESRDSTG